MIAFPRTKEAVDAFDATEPARQARWREDFDTDEDVFWATFADEWAIAIVRAAFLDDTRTINGPQHAGIVGIDWLRKMAEVDK